MNNPTKIYKEFKKNHELEFQKLEVWEIFNVAETSTVRRCCLHGRSLSSRVTFIRATCSVLDLGSGVWGTLVGLGAFVMAGI